MLYRVESEITVTREEYSSTTCASIGNSIIANVMVHKTAKMVGKNLDTKRTRYSTLYK